MAHWISLYLPSADTEQIKNTLETALTSGLAPVRYELYDPFGLFPGKAYEKALKGFIAPPRSGAHNRAHNSAHNGAWTRILFDALSESAALPDDALTGALSTVALCVDVRLNGGEATFSAYQAGQPVDFVEALRPYADENTVRAALTQSGDHPTASKIKDVPDSVLPQNTQAQAERLRSGRIDRMMNRMTRGLMNNEQREAASNLIQGSVVHWDSAGGQRIAALMDALAIEGWREPDFVTVRDAYQQHKRRQRNPKAQLFPGDQAALDAVPDALDYVPIFAGVLGS